MRHYVQPMLIAILTFDNNCSINKELDAMCQCQQYPGLKCPRRSAHLPRASAARHAFIRISLCCKQHFSADPIRNCLEIFPYNCFDTQEFYRRVDSCFLLHSLLFHRSQICSLLIKQGKLYCQLKVLYCTATFLKVEYIPHYIEFPPEYMEYYKIITAC